MKKGILKNLFLALFGVMVIVYLFSLHRDISREVLAKYQKQQEDILYLENLRNSLAEDNRRLEYRKLLLENDQDLYYETILREDYNVHYDGERVFDIDKPGS